MSFVWDLPNCNLPKVRCCGYKGANKFWEFFPIALQEKENDVEFKSAWTEKILGYLKYKDVFKFKVDVTRTSKIKFTLV